MDLERARKRINLVNQKLKEKKDSKRVKIISNIDFIKMKHNMEGSANVSPPNELINNNKLNSFEKELKNINDQLNMLLTTKLSMGDAMESSDIVTNSYETAVNDIEVYKKAKVKRKKVKDNYAVAVCIIQQLAWKLDIDIISYLNIDIDDKKNKGKRKFKGERISDKDMNVMFSQLLIRRNEIERDIANESIKSLTEEKREQEAKQFMDDYKEFQRKTCFQKGKFININWSKLTKEQKIDRINSYIQAKKDSLSDNENEKSEFSQSKEYFNRLLKVLLQLLDNNKLKASNIKWKKNLGYIKDIVNIDIDISEENDDDEESFTEQKRDSTTPSTSSDSHEENCDNKDKTNE